MSKSKRVLIVNGQSIKDNNATGLTMRSIIDYFNYENVLEVYYHPMTEDSGWEKIDSLLMNKKTKTIYNFISKIFQGKIKKNVNTNIVKNEVNDSINYLKKIKNIILAYDDYLDPKIEEYNKNLLNRVEQFEPEIVYTLGSSIFSLKLASYFSNKYNIPIVLHHMDNWRETKYSNNKFLRLPRKKLLETLSQVESNMNYGLTISDEMASTYNQQVQSKYLSLMHTVEVDNRINKHKKLSDEINFVYAGGLHLERWKSLKEIERAIANISSSKYKINLNIFTKNSDKENYAKEFNDEFVSFHDFLPHKDIYKLYNFADILVHVESFDPELIKFTKYSLSTKIPEYMAAGRPILCYAPKNIASSKYIKESESGFAVSNFEELTGEISQLIDNEKLRKTMAYNGLETARHKHSKTYKKKIMDIVFK